jgi:hypothetical protein
MFHSLDEQIESTVGGRPKMTEQFARRGYCCSRGGLVWGSVSPDCDPRMRHGHGAVEL